MDRHLRRAHEALKVADAMQDWVGQLEPGRRRSTTVLRSPSTATRRRPDRGAARRAGHWLQIATARSPSYQIVTPTCWNASPRDAPAVRGPIEQALIGTPVRHRTSRSRCCA